MEEEDELWNQMEHWCKKKALRILKAFYIPIISV